MTASPVRAVLIVFGRRCGTTLKGSTKIHFFSYLILAGPRELFGHLCSSQLGRLQMSQGATKCYTLYMNIKDEHTDDAINIAPHIHTVLYEDDKMRVVNVSVKPGMTAKMHWHPHNINYVQSGGTLKFTKSDGTSVVVELSKGQITSSTSESYHAVENIGELEVETIQVELKY